MAGPGEGADDSLADSLLRVLVCTLSSDEVDQRHDGESRRRGAVAVPHDGQNRNPARWHSSQRPRQRAVRERGSSPACPCRRRSSAVSGTRRARRARRLAWLRRLRTRWECRGTCPGPQGSARGPPAWSCGERPGVAQGQCDQGEGRSIARSRREQGGIGDHDVRSLPETTPRVAHTRRRVRAEAGRPGDMA